MNSKKVSILAKLALFGATLIWGSSFFIMKNTVAEIPLFYLCALRFFTGAVVVFLLCLKRLSKITREYLLKGGVMGALLFIAYVVQTYGLMGTTPGKNAFLTAVYCIIVPFLYWGVGHIRPTRYNVSASFICILGIGLISLNNNFSIGRGDLLTLLSGVFFAAHIVAVAVFSKDRDILLLTLIQFLTAGVLGLFFGMAIETFPTQISTGSFWSLVYLCLFPTAAAFLMQNVGQKYTPPSTAALIMSLESVFGALFSILFYQERLTLRIGVGFFLIFIAVIVSESRLVFLKRFQK